MLAHDSTRIHGRKSTSLQLSGRRCEAIRQNTYWCLSGVQIIQRIVHLLGTSSPFICVQPKLVNNIMEKFLDSQILIILLSSKMADEYITSPPQERSSQAEPRTRRPVIYFARAPLAALRDMEFVPEHLALSRQNPLFSPFCQSLARFCSQRLKRRC